MNHALRPLGFEITRIPCADGDSRPVSAVMVDRLVAGAEPAMQQVAEFFGGAAAGAQAKDLIAEFFELFFAANLRQSPGSSGFNSLMILFIAARTRKPDVIVESGTFQGFGTWALHTACPKAEVHCFDLSYENLIYRNPKIHYHERDWASAPLGFQMPENALGFFDDHVSHGQRILESAERNLKSLVLDDNVSWNTLHRDGLPPAPTVDMLFDATLPATNELAWVSARQQLSYRRDEAFNASVRDGISKYHPVPNLYDKTGYQSTPVALVQLR